MNRKSKLRFMAWAEKKNKEYELKREQRRIEQGLPEKIGRSIMPAWIKEVMGVAIKDEDKG